LSGRASSNRNARLTACGHPVLVEMDLVGVKSPSAAGSVSAQDAAVMSALPPSLVRAAAIPRAMSPAPRQGLRRTPVTMVLVTALIPRDPCTTECVLCRAIQHIALRHLVLIGAALIAETPQLPRRRWSGERLSSGPSSLHPAMTRQRPSSNADFHAGGSAQGSKVFVAEGPAAPPGHAGVCGQGGLAQDG
jgi:hypothetical protein